MLAAYDAADARRSIEELASWSLSRLRLALDRAETSDDPFTPWDERRYRIAAMMHTDVAFETSGRVDSPVAAAHLQIAARLLARSAHYGHLDIRHFAPRWFQVVAAHLRNDDAPYLAADLLARARDWLPSDTSILYESGALAEALATDYALAPLLSSGGWSADAERTALARHLELRRRNLSDAVRWLKVAERDTPMRDASRLRLGRVQALRMQDKEALNLLNSLVQHEDASTAYLASIFAAAVYERKGKIQEAAASYRAALKNVPFGHSGRVGLSLAGFCCGWGR